MRSPSSPSRLRSIKIRRYSLQHSRDTKELMKKTFLLPMVLAIAGTVSAAPATQPELSQMTKRFAPVELKADASQLSAGDKKAIVKLIEAAKIVDVLQLRQRWSGNEALWAALQKDNSPLGKARQE